MTPITVTVDDDGKIINVDFVIWIMNEIADPAMTRKEVARTYAILIDKGHKEFAGINRAILKRWSPSGLQWIKTQAWRILNDSRVEEKQ